MSDGGGGPEERAAALSNSVLASAYVATSSGHAASHGPTDEQSEVTDIWDKMERTRLRDESIERVRDVCASWDAPAVASGKLEFWESGNTENPQHKSRFIQ